MIPSLLLLPLAYLAAIAYALITRRRQGLALSLACCGGAIAAGLWAISRSRASTAGIGVLFLPLYGSAAGASAWGFALLRSRPGTAERLAGWGALAFSLFLIGAQVSSGVSENRKNAQRDERHRQDVAQIARHREEIRLLVRSNPGRETEALSEEVRKNLGDRTFLLPALETAHVGADLLDQLSRSADLGVVLTVARNPRTSPEILERIHRTHAYPDYFAQALAANPRTPPAILRELHGNSRISGLDHWLARNPSTPEDLRRSLAEEENARLGGKDR